MARAETITKLSLDRWAKIIGINPLHFNGVYDPERPTTPCSQPWMQFPWQAADRVGREEVAQAISDAEADIERELGYRLLPTWEIDEWHRSERPNRPELFNLSMTEVRGFAQTVKADWNYLVTGGVRQKDELELAAALDPWADDDDDGYFEVGNITGGVTVEAGTPACEIHIYYPGYAGADEWEIRPINVTVADTTATITFRREQCVLSELYDDLVPDADDSHMRGVDGSDDTNFLETVDVYRVYNDPQTQATFMWEPLGIGCGCNGSGCYQCQYATQTGCLMLRSEPRLSVVSYRPAVWNATNLDFDAAELAVNRTPDIVRLYYYAGWREKRLDCPTIVMDPQWERTVAQYAASKLDRPICECNNVRAWVEHWQRDLAIAKQDEFIKVSEKILDNPFGTTRGAIQAWKRVKAQAIGEGVLP